MEKAERAMTGRFFSRQASRAFGRRISSISAYVQNGHLINDSWLLRRFSNAARSSSRRQLSSPSLSSDNALLMNSDEIQPRQSVRPSVIGAMQRSVQRSESML